MASIFDRVKTLAVDKLSAEEESVTLEAHFTNDLNADSLDLVELIMAFEEEFSQDGDPVEIPDEDAEKINTVGEAVEYLRGKGITDS
ncbi:MAG: acyl carrier protein [Chloroflexi bacterium]|jgi:acyl carrier protein|nr:MAG: acyl carrier protein [Chloroflexota bacterium]